MRKRWLAGALAGCLAISRAAPTSAQGEAPGAAQVGAVPVAAEAPAERPTELPPFIAPPRSDAQPRPALSRPATLDKKPADYDPSYNYLPDRNPGARQPPCPCLPLGIFWVIPSYFLGTTVNDGVPPLVSGGRPGGPTGTLYGGNRLEHDFRSGMRLDTGLWLDRCQNWGVEGHFFFMESSLTNFQARSSDDLFVGRPYSLPGGSRSIDLLGGPGVGRGGIAVTSPLQFLGAEANTRSNLFCEDNRRIDFIAGYRFVRLAEDLRIASISAPSAGPATLMVDDIFRTENLFHGGQVGLTGEYRADRWYVGGTAKVAFGIDWERLDIAGSTRATGPAGTATSPAGLLALPSNSGRTQQARFAVVPEADLNIGYQVTEHCRAFVGYTFLYVSSVARPGQAIDSTVNLSQAGPAPLHPVRRDPTTEFWMQGINFGAELRY